MSEQTNDESLLIDSLLNQLDVKDQQQLDQRLSTDAALARRRQDVANALAALQLLPQPQAPADLVDRTMARIRQARETDALIARHEMSRGPWRPTFSLREMVAVAASLLMLGVIFVPAVRQARSLSQIKQCASSMGQIGSAIRTYASENDDRLPSAVGDTDRWMPGEPQTASNSSALFRLVSAGMVGQRAFVCPGSEASQPFEIKAGMTDFPGGKSIHYSYQHALRNHAPCCTDEAFAGRSSEMAILADRTPCYSQGRFEAEDSANSPNHGRSGQNVLYLDMSVKFARNANAGVKGNNIYLAEGIYQYHGEETPVSATDSFLLPAYTASDN